MNSKILKNNRKICDLEPAKKDYRSSLDNWHDLKQFYNLRRDVILNIIFECRNK